MDLVSVLREVKTWPVEDRILLVRQLWDRLLDEGYQPDLSDEMKAELDRRLAANVAAPGDVVSWEEVMADALKRARP